MQKKLIALAIAGLSGAAFAQSNVTIYGVADATFDSVSANGATAANSNFGSRNRVTSNSSYIGFKGTEDLGGGMKAVFQFENGLDSSNGAAGVWNNRDSYVGIAGNFGTVLAGNVTGPARMIGATMDVNAGATGIGNNGALLGKIGGGAGASAFDQRINNALVYVTPTWSGFHAAIGYSAGFGGTNGVAGTLGRESSPAGANVTGNTAWTLGLIYDNGPIFAGYGYVKVTAKGDAAAGPLGVPAAVSGGLGAGVTSTDDNRFAVKYNGGNWTAGLMYDRPRVSFSGGGDMKVNTWFLPVTFNVTPNGKIIGQYGKAGDVKVAGGAPSTNASMFVLGYEHSLSKRTVAKVLWSQVTNSTNANYDYLYGVSNANSTASTAGLSAGADPRGLSVGIRHSF